LLDREAAFDGKHRRLNAVACLGRQDVGAKQPATWYFGN
jgi:hypothetical protein